MNSTAELVETATTVGVSLFTFIDYSVFGGLLLVSLAIGLYFGFFSKEEQTTEEYLQGGHKMQALPIAMSLIARFVAIFSTLSFVHDSHHIEKFQSTVVDVGDDITSGDLFVWISVCFNAALHSHRHTRVQLLNHSRFLPQQHR